jgi:hypothetical protein
MESTANMPSTPQINKGPIEADPINKAPILPWTGSFAVTSFLNVAKSYLSKVPDV